uniref:Uncharacterized protein n=1 Tax=Borely moumouvirus TaxID=2712067 RepID=A0A6G6ACU5_9VIRU
MDRKFYCVYFCYYMDFDTFYFYGIIEKKTGKHLIIWYQEDKYDVDLEMKHHMFSYKWDYNKHEDLHYAPYEHENDPMEIICYLEDQFKIFYKEMCTNDNNSD